jgi:hypothetical protein
MVVLFLVLDGREVAAVAVEPSVVEPVDVGQGGALDVVKALPGRTSAADGHTSVVIMPVTCGNRDLPRSGRVTTGSPQVRICGGAPINVADQ